jgi:hypothetical protein
MLPGMPAKKKKVASSYVPVPLIPSVHARLWLHISCWHRPTLAQCQSPDHVQPERDLVTFTSEPVIAWQKHRDWFHPVTPSIPKGARLFPKMKPLRIPSPINQQHDEIEFHYRLWDRDTDTVQQPTYWQPRGEWEAQQHRRVALLWQHAKHRMWAIALEEKAVEEAGAAVIGIEYPAAQN